MIRVIHTAFVLAATTAVAVLAGPAQETADLPVIRHDAVIVFDIERNEAEITDTVYLPAGHQQMRLDIADTLAGNPVHRRPPRQEPDGGQRFHYSFTALQSTDQVRFSRENVGGEITATVGPEGIWLSGGAAWLPTAEGVLHSGLFTIITPAGWFPVMAGAMVAQSEEDGRRRTIYEISQPVDDISLVANNYVVAERGHHGILMRTCLLEPDERLSELYLERTAYYLDLYQEMLGPYPYRSFTTVENWFPTGYGMPGWTLLGSMVMRLPHIPYISFGHEIAHNWWGNSVFIDPAEGNWCEGLTVWCADYLYALQESPEAAHEYRRNLLKDYAAYVGDNPERDFPLTKFKSRHSGATRAVGYGKSMAIWHMLEMEIGRDAVLRALRAVYAEFRGKRAAWGDFFAFLQEVSGRDLTVFRRQWLTRTGAPSLHLADAARDRNEVRFTLRQTEPIYDLLVPVKVTTPDGEIRREVRLTALEQSFTIEAPGALAIAVDPRHDLFRHLHAEEIEPTLSRVLAVGSYVFVPPIYEPEWRQPVESFARAFCECEQPVICEDGRPRRAAVNVLVNPEAGFLEQRLPSELRVHGDLVFLSGLRYSLSEYDLVFATQSPGGGVDLVVLTRDAERLTRLGRRLGHYGKYSWLLLPAGRGDTLRGNWQPAISPLVATLAP
jgi:aminopeptidase N